VATYRVRSNNLRVEVARKGPDGKPIRESKTFDNTPQERLKAEKWAAQIELDIISGKYVDTRDADTTTLLEALDRYEQEVTPRKKGAVQERNRISLWKRSDLANKTLSSIRGVDMATWRDKRLADGTSPTTVRNDLTLISHLYSTAIKEWSFESLTNPVAKIRLPTAASARERRLDLDPDENGKTEEQRLLAECDNGPHWLGPMVRLALETAMRQGELLALEWQNIDLSRPVARLVNTKNDHSRTDRTKGRDVPLSPRAIAILEAFPRNISGKVFAIGTMAVVHAFQRACKRAGIEDLRFHDLRHEATTRLFEKGLAVEEVRAITGHKTLAMLMRYTHLRAEDLAKKLG